MSERHLAGRAARPARLAALLLALAAVAAACLPTAPAVPSTVTPSPTSLPTGTPTVIWFPPTATHTPFPTPEVTLTPDLRTGIGELLLRDDFDQASGWELPITEAARASLRGGSLSLVVVEPRAFLASVRRGPPLVDFYAEITAQVSLCMGVDEYGVLARVSGDLDHYRFSASCDGRVRLDRIYRGSAANLVPWMEAGGIPAGPPGKVRLGVWALGEELRFFVDGQHLYTTRDPLLTQGRLGVFARSGGDSAITVSFSELEVRAVSPVLLATPENTPAQTQPG